MIRVILDHWSWSESSQRNAPLISKKVARNVWAEHKEELCTTRTITELSQQSVETVQNATRSSNRWQNILSSYIKHALSTSWANLCSFNGLPRICSTYRSSEIKTMMSIFEYHFQDKESKGTEKQASKNVQLVLQHCCKTSWIIINNYSTSLSKISWFVCGEQINYLPTPKAEANNWSARHRQITIFCDNRVQ